MFWSLDQYALSSSLKNSSTLDVDWNIGKLICLCKLVVGTWYLPKVSDNSFKSLSEKKNSEKSKIF